LRSDANVYLTGLSGSGKSTVGPLLAQRLGWAFLDTDDLIEQSTGMAVTDIFNALGEAAFRERETEMIRHLATMFRELVVSLGGGAVLSGTNRSLLYESGTVVYLKATPDRLAERLGEGAASRPLLKTDPDLRRRLRTLLDERAPLYEKAHLTIETDELDAEAIAGRILAAVS
jgi:shikimate kinase